MSLCPHGYTANWDCPECPCFCGSGKPAGECRCDFELAAHIARIGHRGFEFARCSCVTCAIARQADKRDAKLMLRASRLRLAGVTPRQRADWDEYLEATRHA